MRVSSKSMFYSQARRIVSAASNRAAISFLMSTLTILPLGAQKTTASPQGLAWQVRGLWKIEGKPAPIVTGDAVESGSLLQPIDGSAIHSITVLLPDGQRILSECFTAVDCARGFRLPPLLRRPEPFAVGMLTRIHAVLIGGNHSSSNASAATEAPGIPRDEVMAAPDVANQVHVGGLAANLPNGRYTYDLRPLDSAYPRRFHLSIDKTGPFIALPLPSAGLYILTIADAQNAPRINLFVAAIGPARAAAFQKSFRHAKALMEQWNGDYYGWPIHEFQRAYLQSLLTDEKALSAGRQVIANSTIGGNSGGAAATQMRALNVTAEPSFSPKAGLFAGDTAVTLRCATQGATIHYTVDGSLPIATSLVFRAPIMVKGTQLTIKSFASAAGKRDSPVVTGTFRVGE